MKTVNVDPNSILFSVPTLSNDLAPLDPVFAFHEDEWSQVEFFTNGQLAMVQRMLEEYKLFEAANRAKHNRRKPISQRPHSSC